MSLTLRERILLADPDLKVSDIVKTPLNRLPAKVSKTFLSMRIRWGDNRFWGTSFHLGDEFVGLGHRRGDHYATFPEIHGVSERQAEEVLRAQLEGTLLHELGHAVLDAAGAVDEWGPALARAALEDGAPSTYYGHGKMAVEDQLHEMFAEAFRYWVTGHASVERELPTWCGVVGDVVRRLTPRG